MEQIAHANIVTATDHSPEPTLWGRLGTVVRRGGLYYGAVYAARGLVDRTLGFLDRRLVAVEQRKGLVEPWTINARRYTSTENKQLWNTYDWSKQGEEWTKTPEWKERVIKEMLLPNVPVDSTVLEIGPGGGRWTEVLQARVKHLYVVDVSEQAIKLCRDRFGNNSKIEYFVGSGNRLPVPNSSVDAIWSYDVFVHINPLDAREYFQEFRRILKPGGTAAIHHPGSGRSRKYREGAWRSDLTDKMILDFANENGLEVTFRTTELVNEGDMFSVLRSPK